MIALYHRLRAWNLRIFVVSNLNRVNILMICVIMVMYIDIFYVMKNIVKVWPPAVALRPPPTVHLILPEPGVAQAPVGAQSLVRPLPQQL